MPKSTIEDYIHRVKHSLSGCEGEIKKIIKVLQEVREKDYRVFVLGNGGSLAIAQHFAQDLLKLCDVKAYAYNCPSMITAHANDDGFEYSFFNPIAKLAEPEDLVIIFSCSGKSRNYIEFVSGFPEKRMRIISVVGTDGGFLKTKSELSIHVDSNDYQVCETAFCIIADLFVKAMMMEAA